MNREEAQFILRAYRPNCEDAHDPQFKEALALVKQDHVLARWFSEEQAMDQSFTAKIRGFPTPPDLKVQLLLARTTGQCLPWWRRTAWLAAAASIALLLAVGAALWPRRGDDPQLGQFRSAMVQAGLDMTNHSSVMGLEGDQLRRWLVEHHGETGYVLPPGLADKDIAACKVTDWQGQRVTMLCFKYGSAHLDLFVIDAAGLSGGSVPTDARLATIDGLGTALWRHDGKIYFLVGNQPTAELQRLI